METVILGFMVFGFGMIAGWSITYGYCKNIIKELMEKPEVVTPQSRSIEVNIFRYEMTRADTHNIFGYVMDFNEWILVVDSVKKETVWYKRKEVERIIQRENEKE